MSAADRPVIVWQNGRVVVTAGTSWLTVQLPDGAPCRLTPECLARLQGGLSRWRRDAGRGDRFDYLLPTRGGERLRLACTGGTLHLGRGQLHPLHTATLDDLSAWFDLTVRGIRPGGHHNRDRFTATGKGVACDFGKWQPFTASGPALLAFFLAAAAGRLEFDGEGRVELRGDPGHLLVLQQRDDGHFRLLVNAGAADTLEKVSVTRTYLVWAAWQIAAACP